MPAFKYILVYMMIVLLGNYGHAQSANEKTSHIKETAKAKSYLEEATQAHRKHDLPLADSLASNAILLNDRLIEGYSLRAKIREEMGFLHPALVDYETLVLLNPDDIEARFKKGQLHYTLGNYEQAISDINTVLNSDEVHETTTVFFQTDQEGAAVGAVTINRMQADLFHLRGLAYHGLKDYRMAVEDYNRAILLSNKESTYFNNLGLSYLAMKDTAAAIVGFKGAVKLYPEDPTAHYNLSLLRVDVRRYLKDESNPTPPSLPSLIKMAYEEFSSGNYTAAVNYYEKALAIDGGNAMVLMDLGRAKSKLGRQYEALGHFKRSLEVDEKQTKNYYLMGNAYFQLREYDKANDAYVVYLAYHQDDAGAFYNYGLSLLKTKKMDEACFHLKKALSMGLREAEKPILSFCPNP